MASENDGAIFVKIAAFAGRFQRPEVQTLLHDWDRRIVLIDENGAEGDATTGGLAISIREGALAGMAAAESLREDDIIIRGKHADLLKLLDGSLSPGAAVLNEQIHVDAKPDDQIKLDALSFVLWDE